MPLQFDFRQCSFGRRQVTAHQEFVVERNFGDDGTRFAKQMATPKTQDAQLGGFAGRDLQVQGFHSSSCCAGTAG
ncbi:MAG: hypothetical protein MK102_02875 [Fuerstiella sp.]|nr:hypothetical protein [Fuerstiella sp.]